MSIFDEMVSILQEINANLGANAGDKAAAIDTQKENTPEKDPYQKNEEYIGLNTSIKNLIRSLDNFAAKQQFKPPVQVASQGEKPLTPNIADTIKSALNNVPILNKVIPQMGLLSKIFDTLIKALGVGAASGTIAPIMSTIRGVSRGEPIKGWGQTGGQSSAFGQSGGKSVGFSSGVPVSNASKTETLKAIILPNIKDVFQHLKNAGSSFYKAMQAAPPNADNFKVSGYATPLSKTMQSAPAGGGNNFQNGLSSISKFFSSGGSVLSQQLARLTPAVLGSLLIAPALVAAGLVAVGAGLIKFAKSIVDADRKISMYSPTLSVAWALKDLTDMLLDMKSAHKRTKAETEFLAALGNFNKAIRPILDNICIYFTNLGTALLKLTTGLLELYNSLPESVRTATESALKIAAGMGAGLAAGGPVGATAAGTAIIGYEGLIKPALEAKAETHKLLLSVMEKANKNYEELFAQTHEFAMRKNEKSFQRGMEKLKRYGADTGDAELNQRYAKGIEELERLHEDRKNKPAVINPLNNDLANERPSGMKNKVFTDEESSIVTMLKTIQGILKELLDEWKKDNPNAEIMDVGAFMAGVVNSPLVYDGAKDRAFDYTKPWAKTQVW